MIARRVLAKRVLAKLLAGAQASGVLSGLLRKRHVILTFHRVLPPGQTPSPFDSCPGVSVAVFEALLHYLQERYELVSLEELCGNLGRSRPMAAVTFDDGWRDNYAVAYPVLAELGIPATIFVTTGKIGSCELFWQQHLGMIFEGVSSGALEPELLRGLLGRLGYAIPRKDLRGLYCATVRKCKQIDDAELQEFLADLKSTAVASPGARHFLSADEIVEMAGAGISFGSHADSHDVLTNLPLARVREELSGSKRKLEGILGTEVSTLSYPYGKVSPAILEIARACGYTLACSTRMGHVTRTSHPLQLPRVECEWDGMVDGRGRLSAQMCDLILLMMA